MNHRLFANGAAWLALPLILALAACGGGSSSGGESARHAAMRGTAYGGRQPIVGSSVTVYEAGLASGQAATQIGHATTDAHGLFNIAAFSPAPATGQLVYVVVQGGDAGGGSNAAIELMTVAGAYCDSAIPDCVFPDGVNVNELTTVAATSALRQQLSVAGCAAITGNTLGGQCPSVPGFAGGAGGLVQRANAFAALADATTGRPSAFLANPASGAAVALTLQKLNSLADLLASCVNSAGGSAGDGSACGNLFGLAGKAPDTLTAALQIASSPLYNGRGSALYALLSAPLVYTPTVTAAPANWAVSGQQRSAYLASSAGLDSYAVNSNTGTWTALASAGVTTPQTAVVVDPLGRFVYYAGASSLSLASIDPATGALTLQPSASVDLSAFAGTTRLVIDPSGRFLYAAEGTSGILSYLIDPASGALTATGSVSNKTVDLVIGANGTLPAGLGFFAVGVDDGQTITPYTVDAATGALTVQADEILSIAVGSLHRIIIDPSNRFLYVTDQQKNDTFVLAVGYIGDGPDAEISLSTGGPTQEGTTPLGLSFDPSGRFLYVVNSGDGTVSALGNFNTGFGSDVAGSPFTTTGMSHPTSVVVDPNGRFIYVGGDNGGTAMVKTYAIDPSSGALSAPPSGASTTVPSNESLTTGVVDPSGRFFYGTDLSGSGSDILGYAIDSTSGALLSIPGLPLDTGGQPSTLQFDPSGHYLIASNSSGGSSLLVFAIDQGSGALTPVTGSPFAMPGSGTVDLVFDSSGRYLYSIDNFSQTISGFSFDPASGALTSLGPATGTVSFPQAGAASPVAPFLYVIGSGSFQLAGYLIDPASGALTPVAPPYSIGFYESLFVTPDGRFIYYASGGGIAGFVIDPVAGTLTAIAGGPFGNVSPQGFASDPDSRFLYAVDSNNDRLGGFAIGANGSLTAVPGVPITLFGGNGAPYSVSVDPTGRYLYVTAQTFSRTAIGTTALAYTIDPVTGALTPVNTPSSVTASGTPQAMSISP